MNKYEDPDGSELPKGVFDKEAVLATVAIRRMSKTNQWTDDEEDPIGVSIAKSVGRFKCEVTRFECL